MSYNETKTVLRAELPELRGKTYQEVYPYYLKVIGEPDDLSVYEGEVNFFAYEGEFQEAIDHKNKRWGIDWVLHHHTDYRTEMEMESNGIKRNYLKRITSDAVRDGVQVQSR